MEPPRDERRRMRHAPPSRPGEDHRDLREWLRVPARMALPGWAEARLSASVREQLAQRAGIPLDGIAFGIIDLETTGVSADRHQILEIGLVVQRGGRPLARFSTLVRTGNVIPAFITALTGISEADLDGAPDTETALAQLETLLRTHGVSQLVAHNAPFDRRFLERAWESSARALVLPPFLCSLRLSRRLVRARSYGLDVLAHQLAIPIRGRHRALADAEVTAVLWRELLLRARVQGIHTLEGLEPLARPGRSPRRPTPRRVVDAAPEIR